MGYLIVSIFGYLLGCSNLAYYLSKAVKKDIRQSGTGNLGASNATVLLGWGAGVIVAVHDIGKALDAPAHMRFLLRTRHGGFAIENGVTIEEVIQAKEKGELEKLMLPMDYPLQSLRRLDVDERYGTPVKNGAKLPLSLFPEGEEKEIFRVYLNGTLCGLYCREQDIMHCCIGLYHQ